MPAPRVPLDPGRKCGQELVDEPLDLGLLDGARLVEEVAGPADRGLGLLQHRHVEKDERLAQAVVRAETADRPRRRRDHCCGVRDQALLPGGRDATSTAFFRTPGTDRCIPA
jgi:hypothetical protein